jgi:aryl-alcohol dehydrogenase-like predicted oxidoreductase
MVELALNFCRSNPHASTVIVGIKNREQLRQNIKVGGMPVFSAEEMKSLAQFEWNRDPWTEELE